MALTVITGTAGGLGRACAEAFAADGHTVAGLDLGPQEPLTGQYPWTVDITDADSVTSAFDQITDRFGTPTHCLTVAGSTHVRPWTRSHPSCTGPCSTSTCSAPPWSPKPSHARRQEPQARCY
jgi:NAD(P)-dependent dehydrogenase (short-subunit alcohol dehydrogenase family)